MHYIKSRSVSRTNLVHFPADDFSAQDKSQEHPRDKSRDNAQDTTFPPMKFNIVSSGFFEKILEAEASKMKFAPQENFSG
ncbi:MAG: hypothetical protein EOM03_12945 [Clostridia bacterium]|nr:hypothetical protein [Clostridia bacterium]